VQAAEPQQQQRPFGLLLMTGLNFGFGVWNLIAAGQLFFGLKMKLDPTYLPAGLDPGIVVAMHALPLWFYYFVITTSIVKSALLFTSAWGFFNYKRVAGRHCANAYAVLSLAESAVPVLFLSYGLTGSSVIGGLYALFTLLAVNGPFKALLTR
jgi:hypothetical protein